MAEQPTTPVADQDLSASTGAIVSEFLSKGNAPDVGTLPARYGDIVNLAASMGNAGIADVCEKFRKFASDNIRRFSTQKAREQQMKDGGEMDISDRMYTVSHKRDTTSAQYIATKSNVTSPMFRIQVRTNTSGMKAMLFDEDRLPAEYQPEVNTTEYQMEVGERIALHQNALQQFTFDEDKRHATIMDAIETVNKDANIIMYMEWAYQTAEVTESRPDERAGQNENGTWKKYKRTTTRRPVKDWSSCRRLPLENCYFDAQIPVLANNRLFAFIENFGYEDLLQWQEDGYIANVDQVQAQHQYQGEQASQESNAPLEDRMRNAGEDAATEATGEIEVWTVWGLAPIAERNTPRTEQIRASFDGSKNRPVLYYAQFAGDIHKGGAVCLKLCKKPHWNVGIPATFIHSHRDNKGAFHRGDAYMIKSLYHEAVTNINQAVDNKTKRNAAPLVAIGPVFTRDLTYDQNKLIQIDRATTLDTMDLPDTTQITMEMERLIDEKANKLTGADKPLQGAALGSRTSARESQNVFDMATLPLEERTDYFINQLLPWMYELDAAFWRQYGDPKVKLAITHNDQIVNVNPSELFGPIRTKVTAVARFKRDRTQRQQKHNFLSHVLPLFLDTMSPGEKKILGREVFRDFGFEKANEIFPPHSDFDAESRAEAAIGAMLLGGEWVEPQEQENHAAYIPRMEAAATQYKLLPVDRFNEANYRMLLQHIEARREIQSRQSQQIQQSIQEGAEPQPDEITANPMAAQEGALAQT